jgi:hypothetical protein
MIGHTIGDGRGHTDALEDIADEYCTVDEKDDCSNDGD